MEETHGTINLATIINGKDALVPSIEELVNAPKVAVEIDRGKRKHNAPNEFILEIKPITSYSKRLMVIARKGGGRQFISLVNERGEVLRDYHYHYSGHRNPDHTASGPSHKHFPTQSYPLRESHRDIETWAYDPEPFPDDFIEAVIHFCKECNITIQGLQQRLLWRWFR